MRTYLSIPGHKFILCVFCYNQAETDPFLLVSTKITNCLKDIQPVTAQLSDVYM